VQGDRSTDSLGFFYVSVWSSFFFFFAPSVLPRCRAAGLDVSFAKGASPLRPWKCKEALDWGGGVGGEAGCCYIGCRNSHSHRHTPHTPTPPLSLFIYPQASYKPRATPTAGVGGQPWRWESRGLGGGRGLPRTHPCTSRYRVCSFISPGQGQPASQPADSANRSRFFILLHLNFVLFFLEVCGVWGWFFF